MYGLSLRPLVGGAGGTARRVDRSTLHSMGMEESPARVAGCRWSCGRGSGDPLLAFVRPRCRVVFRDGGRM